MAKTPSLFQTLEKAIQTKKYDLFSKQAYEWLQKEMKNLYGSSTRTTLIKDLRRENRVLKGGFKQQHIGQMFFYEYHAKHDKTLKYWDKYPMGFLIDVKENGMWQMINLHYLNPRIRAVIFDSLLTIANNPNANDTTKLMLSYKLLKSLKKFKWAKPCFKAYLPSQLRSQIMRIPVKYWSIAIFLPVAAFQKAPNSKVWSDSFISANGLP
jgi:hypothetical protein